MRMEILILHKNASEQHGFVVAESRSKSRDQVTVLFPYPAQTHLNGKAAGTEVAGRMGLLLPS